MLGVVEVAESILRMRLVTGLEILTAIKEPISHVPIRGIYSCRAKTAVFVLGTGTLTCWACAVTVRGPHHFPGTNVPVFPVLPLRGESMGRRFPASISMPEFFISQASAT